MWRNSFKIHETKFRFALLHLRAGLVLYVRNGIFFGRGMVYVL